MNASQDAELPTSNPIQRQTMRVDSKARLDVRCVNLDVLNREDIIEVIISGCVSAKHLAHHGYRETNTIDGPLGTNQRVVGQ